MQKLRENDKTIININANEFVVALILRKKRPI